MAKKPTSTSKGASKGSQQQQKKAAPAPVASRTSEVKNSPVPKKVTGAVGTASSAPKREVTHQMIAHRAHEIARSGHGGSDLDNWLRAERELRGE